MKHALLPYLPVVALIALVTRCTAQDINLSPQGPTALTELTGRRISSFQLIAVVLCAPSDRPIVANGGDIFRFAASQGFSWEAPEVTDRIMSRQASLNWRNTLIFGAQVATGIMTTVAGGGIVAASTQVVAGLSVGHQAIDQAIPFVASRRPDPSVVVGLLIKPDSKYELAPKSCISGFLGARYPSGPRTAVVSKLEGVAIPDWFELALARKELEANRELMAVMRSTRADVWSTPPGINQQLTVSTLTESDTYSGRRMVDPAGVVKHDSGEVGQAARPGTVAFPATVQIDSRSYGCGDGYPIQICSTGVLEKQTAPTEASAATWHTSSDAQQHPTTFDRPVDIWAMVGR